MMVSGDINIFRVLCERSHFPNKDEILERISSKDFKLEKGSGSGVAAASMLSIYRRRRDHVAKRALNSDHAARMLREIAAYVIELEKNPDEEVVIWNVGFDKTSSFSLFEGVKTNKILGCIYGVDKRKVTESEWNEIWGVYE
jgi:hypothetical protein